MKIGRPVHNCGMRAVCAAIVVAGCAGAATTPQLAPQSPAAYASIEASHDLDGAVVGHSDSHATIVILFASWCEHCRAELAELAAIRRSDVRILGVNYKGHEEYDHRGGSAAVRAFAKATAPWLRIVPIDEALFGEIGRPPVIPTIFIYDRGGKLVETYDRRQRKPPLRDELVARHAKLRT
jgi:thiol-disulfide isomerase/thioredoxin